MYCGLRCCRRSRRAPHIKPNAPRIPDSKASSISRQPLPTLLHAACFLSTSLQRPRSTTMSTRSESGVVCKATTPPPSISANKACSSQEFCHLTHRLCAPSNPTASDGTLAIKPCHTKAVFLFCAPKLCTPLPPFEFGRAPLPSSKVHVLLLSRRHPHAAHTEIRPLTPNRLKLATPRLILSAGPCTRLLQSTAGSYTPHVLRSLHVSTLYTIETW